MKQIRDDWTILKICLKNKKKSTGFGVLEFAISDSLLLSRIWWDYTQGESFL